MLAVNKPQIFPIHIVCMQNLLTILEPVNQGRFSADCDSNDTQPVWYLQANLPVCLLPTFAPYNHGNCILCAK